MTEFFMPMIPPTITAQEKKITKTKNGKTVVYDPPELKEAKAKLTAHLAPHIPKTPYTGAVRLTVKWLFPKGKTHRAGEYKTTRPDTDNLQKMLKDCMTRLLFWKDDALVASEIVEKFYSETPGIYVRTEDV